MTLNGTLITGVTGMTAQSAAMGVVSNNISNASTIGYKDSVNRFSTLLTNNPGGPSGFGWGGVQGRSQLRADAQGLLIQSQAPTSFAVEGRGFFAVAARSGVDASGSIGGTTERLLTRAGDFTIDKDGFLVNSAGMTLLGVAGAAGGTANSLNALTPLQVDSTRSLPAEASTTLTLGANLPADASNGDSYKVVGQAFTADGTSYGLEYTFTRTAAKTWSMAMTGVSSGGLPVTGATVASTPVTVTFDDNGALVSPTAGVTPGTATIPSAGSLSPSVTLNFTQLGNGFSGGASTSDGHGVRRATGVALAENGTLYQTFEGGVTEAIGTVPLVTVMNPTGLEAVSGTTFAVTEDSGAAFITNANSNGAGKIMGERLERSTVDLADQFSDMIVIQSTYNANSKIITTADSMYATLAQL
jgi:flagellar hook protein FlgE